MRRADVEGMPELHEENACFSHLPKQVKLGDPRRTASASAPRGLVPCPPVLPAATPSLGPRGRSVPHEQAVGRLETPHASPAGCRAWLMGSCSPKGCVSVHLYSTNVLNFCHDVKETEEQ